MRGAAASSGTAAAASCTTYQLATIGAAPADEARRLPSLRGSPRPWESTAPADGAAAAVDDAMPGRAPGSLLVLQDAARYLAARLPGLDSRRAAACFSSSSPVGAMVFGQLMWAN